jgi:hypothetical protein
MEYNTKLFIVPTLIRPKGEDVFWITDSINFNADYIEIQNKDLSYTRIFIVVYPLTESSGFMFVLNYSNNRETISRINFEFKKSQKHADIILDTKLVEKISCRRTLNIDTSIRDDINSITRFADSINLPKLIRRFEAVGNLELKMSESASQLKSSRIRRMLLKPICILNRHDLVYNKSTGITFESLLNIACSMNGISEITPSSLLHKQYILDNFNLVHVFVNFMTDGFGQEAIKVKDIVNRLALYVSKCLLLDRGISANDVIWDID